MVTFMHTQKILCHFVQKLEWKQTDRHDRGVNSTLPASTTLLLLLFIYQKVTYNIHSKFTMQQAGQTGGCRPTALMSAVNLD